MVYHTATLTRTACTLTEALTEAQEINQRTIHHRLLPDYSKRETNTGQQPLTLGPAKPRMGMLCSIQRISPVVKFGKTTICKHFPVNSYATVSFLLTRLLSSFCAAIK